MFILRKTIYGFLFVGIGFLLLQENYASDNASPNISPLHGIATRLNSIKELEDIPVANRKNFISDIEKAFQVATVEDERYIWTYLDDTLICLNWLSSYDLGDRKMQTRLEQKIAHRYIQYANILPLDFEKYILRHMGYMTIDEQGESTVGKQWQLLRNKQMEYRLHFWRRINEQIDPKWKSSDRPVANIMPRSGGISGMSPEAIADPKQRAEYESDIRKNKEKTEHFNQQVKARNFQKDFLPELKNAITSAYNISPTTEDDFDMLKAYLRIYVSDEKLRKELFEMAQAAAKNADNKETNGMNASTKDTNPKEVNSAKSNENQKKSGR
jgi:hypothetical protein